MSVTNNDGDLKQMPFEAAIDKAGFGMYSYLMTCIVGVVTISFASIAFGTIIIVPTSACELQTTVAQQGLFAAGPVVATMLGGVVWGYLADRRGRKSMLLCSLLGGAILNLVASISVNWIMLMILQFTASLFVSGLYSMAMTLLSESVPMAKRNLVVLLVSSIYLLSQGVMSLIAIPIIPLPFSFHLPALGIYWNSWRTLMAVYSLPSILTAFCLFFMQESPKFVYSKGDTVQALEILRTIHRVNNWRSKGELEVFDIIKEETGLKEEVKTTIIEQIQPMFKAPLLKYTIITTTLYVFQQIGSFLVWLPTIANQVVRVLEGGLTAEESDQTMCEILASSSDVPVDEEAVPCALNVTSLLVVLVVVTMHSVFNGVCSTVVNIIGRRNLVMLVTSLCGVSGILLNLVPNTIGSMALFVIMTMGIVATGLYTAILVALFPTNLRVFAIAFAMGIGNLAGFATIQILNALRDSYCDVGFYIYSSLFASSALIALLLPDDRHIKASNTSLSPKKEDDTNEPQIISSL